MVPLISADCWRAEINEVVEEVMMEGLGSYRVGPVPHQVVGPTGAGPVPHQVLGPTGLDQYHTRWWVLQGARGSGAAAD